MDFTTVIALDPDHLAQFAGVWPTWRRFKPEILGQPLLVIIDTLRQNTRWWRHKLEFLFDTHDCITLAPWDWPNLDDSEFSDMTQRERMLTAFVKIPPAMVETEYWLKIDTDTMATAECEWIEPEWFANGPALISNPWGYSKPADVFQRLDNWAATIPRLAPLRAMNLLNPTAGQDTVKFPRIISWLCWVNTVWSRTAADYAPGRLPIPSQDTYHFYVAWRMDHPIRRERFGRRGWTHIHGDRRRAKLIKELMHDYDTECCG